MKNLSIAVLFVLIAFGARRLPTSQAVVIVDWVTVGNPGNAPDQLYPDIFLNNPDNLQFGSVAYTYRISKYEVTNAQYAEFLNAVAATDTNALYNTSMGSDVRGGITRSGVSGSFAYAVKTNMGNKPVNYVSYFDAMRFTNWLQNGQPTGSQTAGTTEAGVYTIGTGLNETRALGANYFLPSENEWYKAAYYQPASLGGDSDDYWLYPTRSNSVPAIATANAAGDISNSGLNVANYSFGVDWNSLNGNVTTVGSAGPLSASYYGTSDQGGNVWEWNEAIVLSTFRGLRGASAFNAPFDLSASSRYYENLANGFNAVGFRVAGSFIETSVAIPEPSTLALLALAIVGTTVNVRRRRR